MNGTGQLMFRSTHMKEEVRPKQTWSDSQTDFVW
jgi:pectin methylesterase-like acyl-CoA thioesterase